MKGADEFEIQVVFDAVYSGVCTINRSHAIKRGDKVARVQHADNPMLPVGGVACSKCIRLMERAAR